MAATTVVKFIVAYSDSYRIGDDIAAVKDDLGAATAFANAALDASRIKNAPPYYIYKVAVTPKLAVRQVTSVSTENLDVGP